MYAVGLKLKDVCSVASQVGLSVEPQVALSVELLVVLPVEPLAGMLERSLVASPDWRPASLPVLSREASR